jgi:hypothetical protein
VQLLQDGDAAKQAAAARAVESLTENIQFCQKLWAPPRSDPSRWPVVAGLVAVLQAPAVSSDGKKDAARAIQHLVVTSMLQVSPASVTPLLHPDVQLAGCG